MWRGWSSQAAARPLEVIAPPAAVAELCQPWADPSGPIRVHGAGHPGDVSIRDGYRIRAHAARHGGPEVGPAVLFDITGPDGDRLLYAVDTAPLRSPKRCPVIRASVRRRAARGDIR